MVWIIFWNLGYSSFLSQQKMPPKSTKLDATQELSEEIKELRHQTNVTFIKEIAVVFIFFMILCGVQVMQEKSKTYSSNNTSYSRSIYK